MRWSSLTHYHLTRPWFAVRCLEQPARYDISFSWEGSPNTLTNGVSVSSPDPWFPRALLVLFPQISWVSLSSERCLFLEGFDGGVALDALKRLESEIYGVRRGFLFPELVSGRRERARPARGTFAWIRWRKAGWPVPADPDSHECLSPTKSPVRRNEPNRCGPMRRTRADVG